MSQSTPTAALREQKGDDAVSPGKPANEDVRQRPKERHLPEAPGDVIRCLLADGWMPTKKGKGDHRNFKHPSKKGKVTVDTGIREIPIGTLRSIYRQAGWEW